MSKILEHLVEVVPPRVLTINDITVLKESKWYKSLKPKLDSGMLTGKEVSTILGFGKSTYTNLVKNGKLPKPDRSRHPKHLYDSKDIERILQTEAYFVSKKDLLKFFCGDKQWNCSQYRFDAFFAASLNPGLLKTNEAYSTVLNAAKITAKLKLRKKMIKEWPTIADLNRESGLNLSENGILNHVKKLRRIWGLKVYAVPKFAEDGTFISWGYKFEPEQYKALLQEEIEGLRALENGYTTAQISQEMGICQDQVAGKIAIAQALGLLNPVTPLYSRERVKYVLSKEEAERLISGEIHVPTRDLYHIQKAVQKLIENPSYNEYSPRFSKQIELQLIYLVKEGNHRAFEALKGMYQEDFYREFEDHGSGMKREDHTLALQTAFYEVILESQKGRRSHEELLVATREKIKGGRLYEELLVDTSGEINQRRSYEELLDVTRGDINQGSREEILCRLINSW